MDRNQIIGMALITALFVAYFAFFKPKPVPDAAITDTVIQVKPTISPQEEKAELADTVKNELLRQKFGELAIAASGKEEFTALENEEFQVIFSSLGGKIAKVVLKKYLTDNKNPVTLLTPEHADFSLKVNTNYGETDLLKLFYKPEITKKGDSTYLNYSIDLGGGKKITQTYIFPKNGYTIGYKLSMNGLDNLVENTPAKFLWKDQLPKVEYDLNQSRMRTTVNYYLANDAFESLSESSSDIESETVNQPIKWVSMKQKFFCSAIIAQKSFEKGYVEAAVPSDTSVVKNLTADLLIPMGDIKTQSANFKYYFGPNHFGTLKKVTKGFEKNVYLGWPVINWINRFIVIPTFDFLDQAFGHMKWKYGIIILILAILVKLITLPLSYKSYVAMAKMKVMKPELDEIKAKYGDDMQKVQQEQMSLYSKVGINPLSGCIPMLLSMPVLLAMFSFFPNSIELRQQSFLWAPDLSTYDAPIKLPFTVPFGFGSHISLFTLLMTLSTLATTHYNNQMNTATGPMKSVSYIMPVVFMFVLNSFPAGLSFYYLVSNLLTIGQQFAIRRFVDEDKIRAVLDENRKKNTSGGGKQSKFMQRVQEAMKAREEMVKNQKKK